MSSVYTLSDPSPNGLTVTEHILPLRQSGRLKQKHSLNLASYSQSVPAKSVGVNLSTSIGFITFFQVWRPDWSIVF